MRFNDFGLKLIMEFEGFSSAPYQDIGGKWTQGFGSTAGITADSAPVTPDEGKRMLESSVSEVEKRLQALVHPSLTDNQYSALICFAYNVGCGSLSSSTLLSKVNAGDPSASDEFLRWDHVNGVVIPGLLRRREAEKNLFDS